MWDKGRCSQASRRWEEQQVVVREWDTGIQDFRGGAVSAADEVQGVATSGQLKGQEDKVLENAAQIQRSQVVFVGAHSPPFWTG